MFNKSTLTITPSALVLMSTGVAGVRRKPFIDVAQNSLVYDVVGRLAADGGIVGLSDGSYSGH